MPLRDGRILSIRPVEPDDKELLVEGFDKLSERSRYYRFLSPVDQLSSSQLQYFTEIDFVDHVALAGFVDGIGVAISRFIRLTDEPTTAEAALTVVDAEHGKGIGPMMLEALAVVAVARGINDFQLVVAAENLPMRRVLDRYHTVIDLDGPVVTAKVGTDELARRCPVADQILDLGSLDRPVA